MVASVDDLLVKAADEVEAQVEATTTTTSKAEETTTKPLTTTPKPAATTTTNRPIETTTTTTTTVKATTPAATTKAPATTSAVVVSSVGPSTSTFYITSSILPSIMTSLSASSEAPSASASSSLDSSSSPSNSSTVGGIVGGVLAALVIGAFALVFIRRNRRRALKNSRVSRTMDELFTANGTHSDPSPYDMYRKNTVMTHQGYQYHDYNQPAVVSPAYQTQHDYYEPQDGAMFSPQAQHQTGVYYHDTYQDSQYMYSGGDHQQQQYDYQPQHLVAEQPYRLELDLGNKPSGTFIGSNDYPTTNYQHQNPPYHQ